MKYVLVFMSDSFWDTKSSLFSRNKTKPDIKVWENSNQTPFMSYKDFWKIWASKESQLAIAIR